MISLKELESYFVNYIVKYRQSYERFVKIFPLDPGYPKTAISPYLGKSEYDLYLLTDGVVVSQIDVEPKYRWYIAGGPAIKVDYEPTVSPKKVTEILKQNKIYGKPIGIYRIVAKKPLDDRIWKGEIYNIKESFSKEYRNVRIKVNFFKLKISLSELVNILTFGAFGSILNIYLPNSSSDIGFPHLVNNLGIFPADLNNRRFFNHLEIYGQNDPCAWDTRTISLRVKNDLRRDFSRAFSAQESGGGTLSFGSNGNDGWIVIFKNRLAHLEKAINSLKELLIYKKDESEATFHKLLKSYPILLDVYGKCESKPKFKYPSGETSPVGKGHLEPDFLICYPNQSYKLVEIERPSKPIATRQGQPRAEFNQASFQIAEWGHFIRDHYQLIKDKYPGIQSKCRSMVVISRSRQKEFGGFPDQKKYMELIAEQYNVDEILTYDDLLERAKQAYDHLVGLSNEK